jgi:predicted ATPase/DNA-binding SARP family transcriptional activator
MGPASRWLKMLIPFIHRVLNSNITILRKYGHVERAAFAQTRIRTRLVWLRRLFSANQSQVNYSMGATGEAKNDISWNITMFNGLAVTISPTQTITRFQTRQTASLFAYLVCRPRIHTRDELTNLLWPESDPENGRRSLSQALSWLKSNLKRSPASGHIFITDRNTIGVDRARFSTDVSEFERLARVGFEPKSEKEAIDLARAVDLFGMLGFLPEFYDDWVVADQQRLLGTLLDVIVRLQRFHEHRGDLAKALAYAQRAIAFDSLSEEAHYDAIRLLAATGQQHAALRQYRELQRLLHEHLNSRPDDRSEMLMQNIRKESLAASTSPPPARSKITPQPLPLTLTRLFGHERLIEEVAESASRSPDRLITLTGTGGAGKTRIALEIGRRTLMSSGTPKRLVAFAALAEVTDGHMIADTVAEAFGIAQSGATTMERLTTALMPEESAVLLILDNVEHILERASAFVKELLQLVPHLVILVTSRRRLGIAGEREVSIPPLPFPDPADSSQASILESPSVQLFVDRSQSVHSNVTYTPESLHSIARLCERLEGLPLAIELCAAWSQTLTPAQMLPLLDQRFDILVSRRIDLPERHRTLRAALEYSFILLPPNLKHFFVLLSVFRGGWDLNAADQVGGIGSMPQTLSILADLREYSLIVAEETEASPDQSVMRYRMLESLREFAGRQMTIGDELPARQQHAQYYLKLALDGAPKFGGPEQNVWLARFDVEIDNFRAALSWLIDHGRASLAMQMASALSQFWECRGYLREARQWLQQVLTLTQDSPDVDPRIYGRTLVAYANALHDISEYAAAEDYVGQALKIWRKMGDTDRIADALEIQGRAAMLQENYDEAAKLLVEALDIASHHDNMVTVARTYHSLGRIAIAQERWNDAWTAITHSLDLHRKLGNTNRVASALNNLGLVARYQGDLEIAREILTQSLSAHHESGGRPGWAISRLNLGTVDRLSLRYNESLIGLTEALNLALEMGDRRVQAWCIKEVGHLASALGDHSLATRLLSTAENLRITLNMSFKPAGPAEIARDRAKAEEALGKRYVEAAWASGTTLTPELILSEIRRLHHLMSAGSAIAESSTIEI